MITAITTIQNPSAIVLVGTVCFGVAVGYITYRTLARTTDKAAITDLATVIGVIGGGVVTTLYGPADGTMFAWYSIGLLIGMALYVTLSLIIRGKQLTGGILGGDDPQAG
ncbi:hypothetical protein [Streptomyces sp. NBC_01244]|uniref:hypothetical protein n=1 Tax=Streptomyces sp. NBC_01244 TaxID=2903797 RepID=UPI002E14B242|nr:hypothetical protein OG247_04355 [Streptomyces sp. NBC_01244]